MKAWQQFFGTTGTVETGLEGQRNKPKKGGTRVSSEQRSEQNEGDRNRCDDWSERAETWVQNELMNDPTNGDREPPAQSQLDSNDDESEY